MEWHQIQGWFQWRSGQEDAVRHFAEDSYFLEVGNYLGRSLCSLAEVVKQSGKKFTVIGIDTCQGNGPEGPQLKNYHGAAVEQGGGTFAGALHKNIIDCGFADSISLIISDSVTASSFFADNFFDWIHLDARHDYESLKEDIRAWLPKVKSGSWFSGDDYNQENWPGVIRAVTEMLPEAEPWSTDQWRWTVK